MIIFNPKYLNNTVKYKICFIIIFFKKIEKSRKNLVNGRI